MNECSIYCLLVVDENGKVIGILICGDIIRVMVVE